MASSLPGQEHGNSALMPPAPDAASSLPAVHNAVQPPYPPYISAQQQMQMQMMMQQQQMYMQQVQMQMLNQQQQQMPTQMQTTTQVPMQMPMQMMYPYMHPPMYQPTSNPGQASMASASPHTSQPHSAHTEQQQQQQPAPPMYAPWHAVPPQMSPTAAPASNAFAQGHFLAPASVMPAPSPPTTTAMGYAQGTPTLNLNLRVAMAPPKKVLIYYVSLSICLLATVLLLLGAWFTPTCRDQAVFSRTTTDVLDGSIYADVIGGTLGAALSSYAAYAPCTVMKQHGCDVLTRQDAANWMSNVTNGMQEPLPSIFSATKLFEVIITSCTLKTLTSSTERSIPHSHRGKVAGSPPHWRASSLQLPISPLPHSLLKGASAAPVDSPFLLDLTDDEAETITSHCNTRQCKLESNAAPGTVVGTIDASSVDSGEDASSALSPPPPSLSNKSGLFITLESALPGGAQFGFFVTCKEHRDTTTMVNVTLIWGANLTGLIPATGTDASPTLHPSDVVAASPDALVDYAFGPLYTNCWEYYFDCAYTAEYVLFSATNEIRRCGGGPVTVDTIGNDGYILVTVCDTALREIGVDPWKNGDLPYTANGMLSLDFSRSVKSVRLAGSSFSIPFDMNASAIMFLISIVLFVIPIVLTVTAANAIPVQRFKLRQLRAALEVDASVAMEILYRAQGAFTAVPPTAQPPLQQHQQQQQQPSSQHTPDTTADVDAALAPAQQPTPPSSMYVTSPFYRPVVGMETMRMGGSLMLAPPMVVGPYTAAQPQPSPYGEAHYLCPSSHGSQDDDDEEEFDGDSEHEEQPQQPAEHAPPPATPTAPAPTTPPPRDDAATPEHSSAASLSGSAKEEDAAFVAPEGVVSPAEVELCTVTPAQLAAHRAPQHGDDARELESLYSAASASPPSSVHAGSDGSGETRAFRSGAPAPTAAEVAQHIDRSATRLHASPPSVPLLPPAPADQPRLHAHAAQQAAPPNTDWMFSQTRHLVSPDVLEESTPSSPRSHSMLSRLKRLRDRVLHRRSASADARAAFPRSDSDDDDDGPAGRHYAGPEASPGERTIQLFVTRARNSYRRARRKQTRMIRAMLLYVILFTIVAALFIVFAIAFEVSGVFDDFSGLLQMRQGDTLITSTSLHKGHIAQFAVALVLSLVAVVLSIQTRKKHVW